MIFRETTIPGAFVVELDPRSDSRGFFARLFCAEEFRAHGLDPHIEQINTGFSHRAGTVRGMHYQRAPDQDCKFVKCLRGAIVDVCLDLRPASPTYRQHVAVELSDANRHMLFLPAGCAHGFQTLAGETEILYTTNVPYSPASAVGVRHDDPAFAINWPLPITDISDADRSWPDFAR